MSDWWSAAPEVIDQFRGRWFFLSNFAPAPLVWEQIEYPTSEHAFSAGKSLDMGLRLHISKLPTPQAARRAGRELRLRRGWKDRARYQVMAEVLRAKFTAHPERVQALLSTGDAVLIEGQAADLPRHWHDNHWGDCRCGRPACAEQGQNHLGRLLMELRAELRGGR